MYEVAFKVKYFKVLWIKSRRSKDSRSICWCSLLLTTCRSNSRRWSALRSASVLPGDLLASVFAGQWHTLAVQAVTNVSADMILSLQWATVEKQTTGTLSLRPPVTKVIEGISKNRLAANKLESGAQLQHSSSCLAATPNLRTLYLLSSATLRT